MIAAAACGGSGGATSTSTSPSTVTTNTAAIPAAPAGCEAWSALLGDQFSRMSVVANLCLVREASTAASEYKFSTRRVIYRNPAPASGEIGSISHEICHAHQHRVILDSGTPDINVQDEGDWGELKWMATLEGAEYLVAAGYTYLGPSATCTRSVQPGCWSQSAAGSEMGFALSSYGNPMEDNAQFCATWYNPGGLTMWAKSAVTSNAPRRSAWAEKYLR
jgi:hypothetical protein